MQRETIEQRIAHQTLATRTRRHFLQNCATGIGGLWLATQAQAELPTDATKASASPLSVSSPPLPAKVKRVIYLHMVGAPSQLELFDYKPELNALNGKDCPASFLEGKRFATMHSSFPGSSRLKCMARLYTRPFQQASGSHSRAGTNGTRPRQMIQTATENRSIPTPNAASHSQCLQPSTHHHGSSAPPVACDRTLHCRH